MARGVLDEARCRDRLDAMLAFIDAGKVEVLADDEIDAVLHTVGTRQELERGGLDRRGSAKELIVFARFDGGDIFPGYAWNEWRDGGSEARNNGVLCHSAIEIQSAVGCAFDCTYCPYTSFICIRLDVERFVDEVAGLVRRRRAQTLFKLNNRTDTLSLEPEYGLAGALVERFADLPGNYLMLYSKGDAVDHLLELNHAGKTVACFTLTPEPVAALLETGAPSPSARLEAISKLAAAGYPIRVRFSPIVPLQGWRDMYADLISRLCAVSEPELVTMWTLSMIDIENLGSIVPLEAMDQQILSASRAAADQMRGNKGAPFPPAVRSEIYESIARMLREVSPRSQSALCLELSEVWDAASSSLVPRRGGNFVCNCGPRASPEALVGLGKRQPARS